VEKWFVIGIFVLPLYVLVMGAGLHALGIRRSKLLKSYHRKFPVLSLFTTLEDPEDYAQRFSSLRPEAVRRYVAIRLVVVGLGLILFNMVVFLMIIDS
jgi:hypothetical protein